MSESTNRPPVQPPADASTSPVTPKKVAVIVVHGVGTSPLGETARGISGLLLRLRNKDKTPVYSSFEETSVQFPTKKVPGVAEPKDRKVPQWDSRNFATDHLDYIDEQLKDFAPTNQDETFSTIKIKSKRGGDGPEVDLYDMYWADICRGGNGFLRFFIELYQLFFHLGSLGERTVHSYAGELGKGEVPVRWKPFTFSISLAYRWLSRTILFFNIFMILPTLLLVLEEKVGLHHYSKKIGAGLIISSVVLFFSGITIQWIGGLSRRTLKLLLTTCAALIGIGILMAWLPPLTAQAHHWLFLLVSLLAFFGTLVPALVFVEIYERSHPQSRQIGWTMGVLMSGVFAGFIYLTLAQPPAEFSSLLGDQFPVLPGVTLGNYALSWLTIHYFLFATVVAMGCTIVLLILEIAVALSGFAAIVGSKMGVSRPKSRVYATALMSLGLSTVALNIIGVTLWSTVYLSIAAWNGKVQHDPFAEALLGIGTIGSSWMLVWLALFLFTALLILLPSLLHEIFSPKLDSGISPRLGRYLTLGGGSFNLCVLLLFIAAIAPLWSLLDAAHQLMPGQTGTFLMDKISSHGGSGVSTKIDTSQFILTILGLMGVGFFALKNAFDSISIAVGGIIDRILDVDEYLREFPRNWTPKARMFFRYHALMKGIHRGNPGEPGYDRVIVFAHSQGSIASCDYFRYLSQAGKVSVRQALEEEKSSVQSIHLFTMGNPIRQLYAWRFPTWYNWAWPEDDPSPGPRIEELAIDSWSNIYGSGDYVGRSLWHPMLPQTSYFYAPPSEPWLEGHAMEPWEIEANKPNQREKCLGNAAHTHYWDTANDTGSEVCVELDRLIMGRKGGAVVVVPPATL